MNGSGIPDDWQASSPGKLQRPPPAQGPWAGPSRRVPPREHSAAGRAARPPGSSGENKEICSFFCLLCSSSSYSYLIPSANWCQRAAIICKLVHYKKVYNIATIEACGKYIQYEQYVQCPQKILHKIMIFRQYFAAKLYKILLNIHLETRPLE